jgi:hypothetical protein
VAESTNATSGQSTTALAGPRMSAPLAIAIATPGRAQP